MSDRYLQNGNYIPLARCEDSSEAIILGSMLKDFFYEEALYLGTFDFYVEVRNTILDNTFSILTIKEDTDYPNEWVWKLRNVKQLIRFYITCKNSKTITEYNNVVYGRVTDILKIGKP